MRKQFPPAGARAICLARYSTDRQNPKSADDQIREAIAYCEKQGWHVVATHKDEALTGRTLVGRKGFYKTMAAAEAGDCDVIVVEDVSRFARDVADTTAAARKLDENNVVLCTVSGGLMTGLELVIRAQMAQEQSEETAYRVKRGQRSAAARGRVVGNLAYGYCKVDGPGENGGNRKIDEVESKVVRRIFADLAAGLSAHSICIALNTEGVPGPKNKPWRAKAIIGDPGTMAGIARNPIYVGRSVYGKTQTRFIRSTGKKKSRQEPLAIKSSLSCPSCALFLTIFGWRFKNNWRPIAPRQRAVLATHLSVLVVLSIFSPA